MHLTKNLLLLALLFSVLLLSFCQNPQKNQNDMSESSEPLVLMDTRPKDQLYFLNKIKAESDEDFTGDALKKDNHIEAFNKYAADSLKNINNWEMIVDEINDDAYYANTVAKATFNLEDNPIYNLALVAPIKPDNTVDTIAIDNRVDFKYTILKAPKSVDIKKQLSVIKTLTKGDTIIISGAITHLDNNLKVNFGSFFNDRYSWNLDVLITDIRKKSIK